MRISLVCPSYTSKQGEHDSGGSKNGREFRVALVAAMIVGLSLVTVVMVTVVVFKTAAGASKIILLRSQFNKLCRETH